MATFYNIKGASVSGGKETTELLKPNADRSSISSIMLTNVHATADATVTLFIQDSPASSAANTYNIIHTIAIPADSSLLLDNASIFRFSDNYGLYITVAASDTVDVIIS